MSGELGTGVRRCSDEEHDDVLRIINNAAEKYRGVIPGDCFHDPYMSRPQFDAEIAAGVRFFGVDRDGVLAGVMGVQDVDDVTLIRHAYVRPDFQGRGIGTELLTHLRQSTQRPVLIGTWADAAWAIRFYQSHGFCLVAADETPALLRKYWTIGERQIATSVVLRDR